MPGPKTHQIFYKQLKEELTKETLSAYPNYDQYSIFAQGHDFLIYHDYYKINKQAKLDVNVHNSILLQEWSFQEFVYNFLKASREIGAIESEQVRAFLIPGYIMHHILDSYTHPQIIYTAGDHERDPESDDWKHGIIENLIDIYMMEKYENINPKTYKVYRDFKFSQKMVDPKLIRVLNDSLQKTYAISRGGKIFKKSFSQVESFMRNLKYDPTGIKRILFDYVNPKLIGTSSFSYHRDSCDALKYLNLEHEKWVNPMDASIESTDSFIDLYNKALKEGAIIMNRLEKVCQSGIINKDEIYDIIPNKASTHGLECGQHCKISNRKL